MNKKNRKLIRQLEKLQVQVDKLKQNYLQQLQRLPAGQNRKPEKEETSVAGSEALQEKNRELLELALRSGKENELYKVAEKKIKSLIKSGKNAFSVADMESILTVMEKVKDKTDNWEIFRQQFSEIYKDFFDNLLAAHPGLTKTELKFCAYLRIHMTSRQIASAMDISMEAIRKNRYRIRKKLNLHANDSLESYIDRF